MPEMNHHAKGRRARVLRRMEENQAAGRTCIHCLTGRCCTFQANSMQITPLEAWDMMVYLRRKGRWTTGLQKRLEECVIRYRLDQEVPGDGQRPLMRRTYTCPFFVSGALGCSISRERKPVGCLAFNPRRPGITDGQDCGHDANNEHMDTGWERRNQRLRKKWNITWEKLPIPLAILEFFSYFNGHDEE